MDIMGKDKNMYKRLELVAPAGNINKLGTAFLFGADAAYLGLPAYSLRTRINDFDWDSLGEGIALAHSLRKKAYVTLNIIAHNQHFIGLASVIKRLKKLSPDALIISDPGIMAVVWRYWPDAKIHLSTQANCINAEAAKFWYRQGVRRIVLGREASLEDIQAIHRACPQVELEYFVHGAMCMAYSGRCFLSKWLTNRSGNLGDCAQACRFEYHIQAKGHEKGEIVEEENGTYILNSKDLCLIRYLDKLAAAGITSFKIEGRAKSVYYQALVSGAYRRAIDSLFSGDIKAFSRESRRLEKELKDKLVNRSFSTGFLLGGRGEEKTDSAAEPSDWEFCGQVVAANLDWSKKTDDIFVRVHNTLKAGMKVEIILPGYGIIRKKITKMHDAISGEELAEAHGGGGSRIVRIFLPGKDIPAGAVLTRKKL